MLITLNTLCVLAEASGPPRVFVFRVLGPNGGSRLMSMHCNYPEKAYSLAYAGRFHQQGPIALLVLRTDSTLSINSTCVC
jgi:hypothetical protein